MFYAQFVLSKKGPLAKIWLAAHWEKKLTKNQVYETNVADAVDAVLEPKVKMALRTTGHLLLGIVRIYSRKAKYLLADCNEAFLKIKMAFRPGQVDLPEEGREAAGAAINLPEVFADFDAALPDFQDFDNVSQMAMNQSRIDDITMKEDLPSRSGISELGYGGFADDFGDAGMDGLDSYGSIHMRDAGSSIGFTPVGADAATKLGALGDLDAPIPDDFGGQLEDNIFMDDIFNDEALLNMDIDNIAAPGEDITTIVDADHQRPGEPSLNLDPLEATVMQNLAERAGGRGRRKRRLVVDEVKNIPGDEMKAQLQDYSDLVRPSVLLAPPTKRLMVYDGWPAEKVLAAPTSALLGAKGLNRLHAASLMPSAAAAEAEQERAAKSALIDELNLNRDPSLALPEEPVEEAPAEMAPSVSPPPRSPSPAPLASPTGDSPSKRRKSKPANRPDQSALEESGEVDESGLDGDEKKFTRRTAAVLQTIRRQLEDTDELTFTDICGRATRKTAAAKFYTLLTLKKWEQVAVEQTEPFGPIQISLGAKFGEIPVA